MIRIKPIILAILLCIYCSPVFSDNWFKWFDLGYSHAITDVNFHGKVIDQGGFPLSGAKVDYIVTGQYLAAGSGVGYMITNEQGFFKIAGSGAGIVIQNIRHPNALFNTKHNDGNLQIIRNQFSPQITIDDWNKYKEETPYIFNVWRVNEFESVQSRTIGRSFVPDGRTYTINFEESWINQWKEGVSGQLKFSCIRGEMAHIRDFQDWKVIISVVNGGIQKTEDIFLAMAPTSGYSPSIIIQQKASSPDYKDALYNQRLFFTANNGRYYGSLFMHIRPHFRQNDCDINVSSKVNLEGSRNLAIQPYIGDLN